MGVANNPAGTSIRDWKWSPTEKAVARRAFDLALGRQRETVVREAKKRAARITEASELWDLERWLSERRREIDSTFDFRYSVLPLVFAALLRNRSLSEDDLRGLAQNKLEGIRHMAGVSELD